MIETMRRFPLQTNWNDALTEPCRASPPMDIICFPLNAVPEGWPTNKDLGRGRAEDTPSYDF